MWVGLGPWDQAEDDNPGRTLCVWASKLSLTDGRREKGHERGRGSWRAEKRATILQTSFCFILDLLSGDPVASMKPAFVSIDFLTGSSSTHYSACTPTD